MYHGKTYNWENQWVCIYAVLSQLVCVFVPMSCSIISTSIILSINSLSVYMYFLKELHYLCVVCKANSSHLWFKGWRQPRYCYSTVPTQLVTYHTRTWQAGHRVTTLLCHCVNWYCQLRFLEVFMDVCRVNKHDHQSLTLINRHNVINKSFWEVTNQRLTINIIKKKKKKALSDNIREWGCKLKFRKRKACVLDTRRMQQRM